MGRSAERHLRVRNVAYSPTRHDPGVRCTAQHPTSDGLLTICLLEAGGRLSIKTLVRRLTRSTGGDAAAPGRMPYHQHHTSRLGNVVRLPLRRSTPFPGPDTCNGLVTVPIGQNHIDSLSGLRPLAQALERDRRENEGVSPAAPRVQPHPSLHRRREQVQREGIRSGWGAGGGSPKSNPILMSRPDAPPIFAVGIVREAKPLRIAP